MSSLPLIYQIIGDTNSAADMNNKHFYLAVTGTMGSGKTTAAKLLAKHLKLHLVEENFGENAFLPRFYGDMKRWAFHSQTFFLMEKVTQMLSTAQLLTKTSVIQDTPIYQDVFSYAKALHVMGNMDDAEWRLYLKIYRSMEEHLPKPDCIIYLRTTIPAVEKRIAGRSRSYEKKVPEGYLELLEMLNEAWMKKESNGIRIVTVDTDALNIVRRQADKEKLIKQVKKECQ